VPVCRFHPDNYPKAGSAALAARKLRRRKKMAKFRKRFLAYAICFLMLLRPTGVLAQKRVQDVQSIAVTVSYTPGRPSNRIIPSRALGAGVDGHGSGETAVQLSPANIKAMLSAGFKPSTYRLRTELAGEAWHWNPVGAWSDAANRQGYWTSNSEPGLPIQASYGYRLPRRGNTIDQANDDGYSRIDDGDTTTIWKSNPYLDEHFTGEKNAASPQWVLIDLGEKKPVDAIRILWAQPFAASYSVEYGQFVGKEDIGQRLPTEWHTFPNGNVVRNTGGDVLLRLADTPVTTKYVRILLNESSGTAPGSTDIRDRLGYAIREIYLGALDGRGHLNDDIQHGTAQGKQTDIYVSSTDPWHRATDLDRDAEQPGFDFIFQCGLTNGLPMLVPVPVLFDTPENAAAEIQYLKTRGYPFRRVEIGEEPDGQFVEPEQFGALYLQFEKAIHKIDPTLELGGPSLQDIERSQVPGRIEFGKAGWMGRFLSYLKRNGRLDKFAFFSFEWYPFPDDNLPQQLPKSTRMITDALDQLSQGGLTRDIPWIMTEYGYSAFGARAEIELDGALANADSVGRFLTMGGEAAYVYGYEPGEVIHEPGRSTGNNMLFFRGDDGEIKKPAAVYWGARLLTQEWVKPRGLAHEIYPAVSNALAQDGDQMVTAYAVHRPDGLWALMLINRDPQRTFRTAVTVQDTSSGSVAGFLGPVDLYQYSEKQYELGGTQSNPYPVRSDPPDHKVIQASELPSKPIELPPRSLTVIRGSLGFQTR
jgi:hypothetical protein